MNIIVFIPARGGSKSVPRKNLKLLGDVPLIVYSIKAGLQLGLRTIVNTDDPEISSVAREFGAETMRRPDNLAKDNTSTFEVLRSEVSKISPVPDLILLLQPTSPFRKSVHIKFITYFLPVK